MIPAVRTNLRIKTLLRAQQARPDDHPPKRSPASFASSFALSSRLFAQGNLLNMNIILLILSPPPYTVPIYTMGVGDKPRCAPPANFAKKGPGRAPGRVRQARPGRLPLMLLLVRHDFANGGFSIVGTLQRATRRYTFESELRGLRS